MAFRSFLTYGACALLPYQSFAATKLTAGTVKEWCATTKPSAVVKIMLSEVIPQPAVRMAFVKLVLAGQGGACTAGLTEYFDALSQEKNLIEAQKKEGVKSLLVVGLAAQIQGAVRIVEREILQGALSDWLPTLEQANPKLYADTLRRWATSNAATIRAQSDLTTQKQPDALIVDRYFRLFTKGETLAEGDYKNINILFAVSNGGARDAYASTLAGLLRQHDVSWLPTVRTESAAVQLRLLPLMVKVGGPEVMRELMWMADANRDRRVRALASRSIDDMVK